MKKHTEYFDKEIDNKIESLKRAIKGDAPKEKLEKILEEIDIIKDAKLALILPVVVKSLPTKDDALNQIGKRLIEEDIEYVKFIKDEKQTGFFTGFLECYKWLTD